jgi:cellulose synthase/poly-beta-1,6-N-acetylglucosamine synthase-like glycosyltransferase
VHERAFDELVELYRWRFGIEDPSLLDWTATMRVRPPNTVVSGPAGEHLSHPDRSVHIVVLDEQPSATRLAEARRVARDAVVVWGRNGELWVQWLRYPHEPSRPEVSVLVPTAGAGQRLDDCLRAISETTPAAGAIEVVVADAGTADAAAVAAAWSARHVRADPAGGAIGAINAGAEAARGQLLVIVGDRTRVLAGWLRPLARTLRDAPDVGVAGGQLLAADRTVEAAAGLGNSALDPRGVKLRDVPYVPAGLLATRRDLLLRLGGFDRAFGERLADVDYCLRVRAAGPRVVHQPQSVAVADAPPAASDDAQRRFIRRWTTPLSALPPGRERFDAATWAWLG